VLRYFGDEAETLSGCGRCDACIRKHSLVLVDAEQARTLVRKTLSGVARVHGQLGLTAAVHLLRGDRDPRLERAGLEQTRTFGVLAGHDKRYLQAILRRCVAAGLVSFSGDEHPVLVLTQEGAQVMRGESRIEVVLPEAKQHAAFDDPQPIRTQVDSYTLDATAEAVFSALRAHRMTLAREQGVPPYVIANDRSLRDLAMIRPRSLGDLLMVHGIGPAKVERYGAGFLKIVAEASATPS
jgi:ATP-dependent DNA helicase RecQ